MKTSVIRLCVVAATALTISAPAGICAQQSAPLATTANAEQDSILSQQERAQWEALKAQDTTTFARLVGGGLVDVDLSGIKRTTPASTARYVLGCQTTNYTLTNFSVAHFGATAVVSYKAAVDATCWGQKAPSPLYVMTVYEQRGTQWQPVAHSETAAAHW